MQNTFTAVNTYPFKLVTHKDAVEGLLGDVVKPIHVTLMPTYNCNLSCPFCSCANANRDISLPLSSILPTLPIFSKLGTKAVTLSGGGEPLCYPDLPKLITAIHNFGIEVGLITNGTLINILPTLALRRVLWCRVSVADTRPLTPHFFEILHDAVVRAPKVDWGFSYVLTDKPNIPNLLAYVDFALSHNFTHVRVVDDLLNLDKAVDMAGVKEEVEGAFPQSKGVMVYLSRKQYVRGCKDCRISLLRPIIGADGGIYPCCGTSSAHADMDLTLPTNMQIGTLDNIESVWGEQKYFNGEHCHRCYYDEYNQVLNSYFTPITHHNFV